MKYKVGHKYPGANGDNEEFDFEIIEAPNSCKLYTIKYKWRDKEQQRDRDYIVFDGASESCIDRYISNFLSTHSSLMKALR